MAELVPSEQITPAELRLATRNHGMPLEALAYDVTPVGMHYLLAHYDIPLLDSSAWRLRVGGVVREPLELSLDDLRARPAVTIPVTMECAGNARAHLSPRPVSQPWLDEAVGTAQWTGTPLRGILQEAGIQDSAEEVVFSGADRGVEGGESLAYERSLTVAEAMREDVLVAYGINGRPLPPQHGHPARLLVPGWYGMASVKWLTAVTAVIEPFTGLQQARAYRLRQEHDEPGEPLATIAVRALMVPPGVPEFPSRQRFVETGASRIEGRAWSGNGEVTRVEVSDDGGTSWWDADVEPRPAPYAWQRWSTTWALDVPGEYELCCRATDAGGETQPLEPPWNVGGYGNNAVQRLPVTVLGADPG